MSFWNDTSKALLMSVGVAGAAVTALAESETRNETQEGHLGIGPFRQAVSEEIFVPWESLRYQWDVKTTCFEAILVFS